MSFTTKIRQTNWARFAQIILPYIVIITVTYLMINYQIYARATLITSDRFLHFYRFYDTSMQIKTGNYSFFQTNFGFNQSGRIFNALYGPFFAYINGLALLICGTWFRYQIFVDFAVFLIGGIGMYRLGLKAKVNDFIALLLAVLYLQFGIMVGMLRANNFMAWGAAFAPYVLMQAVNMMEDKKRPIHWLSLGVIMAIVAQVHVLSTVFLALTLVPFAIYGLVKTENKKQMIIDFFKAVGTCIVLTANIWGSFLVVYPGNKIAAPNKFALAYHTISLKKFYFQHGNLSSWLLILMLIQLIYVVVKFKKSALNDMATIVSLVIIFIASKYFPWSKVQGRIPKLGSFLQFPYRIAIGAYPLILLAIGLTLTQVMKNGLKISKEYAIFIVILAILQTFAGTIRTISLYTKSFLDPDKVVTIANYYKLPKDRQQIQWITQNTNNGELFDKMNRAEPDYLPINPSANNLVYAHDVLDNQKKYQRHIVGDKMILTWTSKKDEKRRLPIVLYKRSKLLVNGKDVTNTAARNTINNPLVNAKKGKNEAVLSYQTPVWFWGLVIISILAWIGVIGLGIYNWIKKLNRKN